MSKEEDINGNAAINVEFPSDSILSNRASTNVVFDPDEFVDYDDMTRLDLVTLLKETESRCRNFARSKANLENLVNSLEKNLCDQAQKCKGLEDDRAFLRTNIRKVSSSWFDRKSKLSEGDHSDTPSDDNKDESNELSEQEVNRLYAKLKSKTEKLELSEMRCFELSKRLNDFEQLIGNQEVIIHGMKDQLSTYFNDNHDMSKQLKDINTLFYELELVNEKEVNVNVIEQDCPSPVNQLPTENEFNDMAGSVSKTYLKLKELIYEKRSLVTEIERLQILNVELQHRVSTQENRLTNVTDALQTTWLLVSNLKEEHAKIHSQETILRYELKNKREILNNLKIELESSREQWKKIRDMNAETEHEWKVLREELDKRRELSENGAETADLAEELEGAVGGVEPQSPTFEPPVDLLLDMAVEYGVVDADDEEPTTVVALIEGEDVHEDRLQNLEDQCCHLYQKLMSSTQRALTLASHLTSLHEHYGSSDTESDSDSDDEDYEGNDELENNIDSEMVSPDSESYDTAYVSEGDGPESSHEISEIVASTTTTTDEAAKIPNDAELEATLLDSTDLTDESCDLLSRKLITFLPKKIEILRGEIKKLEEKLQVQQDEKAKTVSTLNAAVEAERRQRRQAEDQLKHLGKCVDDLKLERNGKIAEVERELEQKIKEVERDSEVHEELECQHESLNEKFEQRGSILRATLEELQKTEKRASQAEENLNDIKTELEKLNDAINQLKNERLHDKVIANEKAESFAINNSSLKSITEKNSEKCLVLPCQRPLQSVPQNIILAPGTILKFPVLLHKGCIFSWCFKVIADNELFDQAQRQRSVEIQSMIFFDYPDPERNGVRFCIMYENVPIQFSHPPESKNTVELTGYKGDCDTTESPKFPAASITEDSTVTASISDTTLRTNTIIDLNTSNREESTEDTYQTYTDRACGEPHIQSSPQGSIESINAAGTQEEVVGSKINAVNLISPIFIPNSSTDTRGKLTTKADGVYTLVFHNPFSRPQEIMFQLQKNAEIMQNEDSKSTVL